MLALPVALAVAEPVYISNAAPEPERSDEVPVPTLNSISVPPADVNTVGFEEEEVFQPRVRNPDLAMDRKRTQSIGGLGRDEESGCCGCVLA